MVSGQKCCIEAVEGDAISQYNNAETNKLPFFLTLRCVVVCPEILYVVMCSVILLVRRNPLSPFTFMTRGATFEALTNTSLTWYCSFDGSLLSLPSFFWSMS